MQISFTLGTLHRSHISFIVAYKVNWFIQYIILRKTIKAKKLISRFQQSDMLF